MSEAFPPLYNFNGIDFNADFFAIPNSGGGGISIAYANSHYLTNYAGAVSTSSSSSTTFYNDVSIGAFAGSGNPLLNINGTIELNNDTGLNGEIAIGNSSLGGNYGGNLYIKSPTALVLNSGNSLSTAVPDILISSTGNVGIGTTTTIAKFSVSGSALFEVTTPPAGLATAIQIIRTSTHTKPIFCIDNTTPPRGIGKPLMNIGLASFTPSTPGDYFGIGYGFGS